MEHIETGYYAGRGPLYKDIDLWSEKALKKWIGDVVWRCRAGELPAIELLEIISMNLLLQLARTSLLAEEFAESDPRETEAVVCNILVEIMTQLRKPKESKR
jgi:hypothetical protein